MSGLLTRRASWRRRLRLSYRGILGFVLLATQALVSPLLAQPGYYSWKALAEVSSVLIYSGGRAGMGARILDGDTIVTCAHVIGDPNNIKVEGIGMPEELATLVAQDVREDIAILRVKTRGIPFKMYWLRQPLTHGTSVLQAFKLHFEGPAGFNQATAIDEMWSSNIVIDSVPKPGYSGGAVFLANGQLVGITKGEAITNQKVGSEIIPIWKVRDILP